MLIVPGATSNHSFWIVYKANADFSSPLSLSSVSVNSNYQFVLESGTQAAILAMNNVSGDAGYYYTSSKGTVTIKKQGGVVTAEIRDAFFTDLMDDMCKLAETGMSMNIKSVSEAEYCTFKSPLGDFQDALDSDEAVGYNIKWDEEGVFGVAAVDGINAYVKSEKDYEDNSLKHVKEGKQVVLTPEFAGREAREALIADMERFIQRHKKPIRKKLIPMKI